jgi:hypothetical protein
VRNKRVPESELNSIDERIQPYDIGPEIFAIRNYNAAASRIFGDSSVSDAAGNDVVVVPDRDIRRNIRSIHIPDAKRLDKLKEKFLKLVEAR